MNLLIIILISHPPNSSSPPLPPSPLFNVMLQTPIAINRNYEINLSLVVVQVFLVVDLEHNYRNYAKSVHEYFNNVFSKIFSID